MSETVPDIELTSIDVRANEKPLMYSPAKLPEEVENIILFFLAAHITSIKIFNKKILQEFVCEHKIWQSFCHNTRKQRENAVRHLSGHWPQL